MAATPRRLYGMRSSTDCRGSSRWKATTSCRRPDFRLKTVGSSVFTSCEIPTSCGAYPTPLTDPSSSPHHQRFLTGIPHPSAYDPPNESCQGGTSYAEPRLVVVTRCGRHCARLVGYPGTPDPPTGSQVDDRIEHLSVGGFGVVWVRAGDRVPNQAGTPRRAGSKRENRGNTRASAARPGHRRQFLQWVSLEIRTADRRLRRRQGD